MRIFVDAGSNREALTKLTARWVDVHQEDWGTRLQALGNRWQARFVNRARKSDEYHGMARASRQRIRTERAQVLSILQRIDGPRNERRDTAAGRRIAAQR